MPSWGTKVHTGDGRRRGYPVGWGCVTRQGSVTLVPVVGYPPSAMRMILCSECAGRGEAATPCGQDDGSVAFDYEEPQQR